MVSVNLFAMNLTVLPKTHVFKLYKLIGLQWSYTTLPTWLYTCARAPVVVTFTSYHNIYIPKTADWYMPVCVHCGFEVNVGWDFCPNCSSKIIPSESSLSIDSRDGIFIGDVNHTVVNNDPDLIANAMVKALHSSGLLEQGNEFTMDDVDEETDEEAEENAIKYISRLEDFAYSRFIDLDRLRSIFNLGLSHFEREETSFEVNDDDYTLPYRFRAKVDAGIFKTIQECVNILKVKLEDIDADSEIDEIGEISAISYVDVLEKFAADCGIDLDALRDQHGVSY